MAGQIAGRHIRTALEYESDLRHADHSLARLNLLDEIAHFKT